MADTLTIDPAAFERANTALQNMQNNSRQVREELSSSVRALQAYSELSERIKHAPIVDPKAKEALKGLEKELEKIGVTKGVIAQAAGKEVTAYSKLSLLDKMRVRMMTQQQEQKKRLVLYDGQMVTLEAKQLSLQQSALNLSKQGFNSMKNTAMGAVRYATSMGGIELSLMGIVALLLKMTNEYNKLGAMQKQAAAQWGDTNSKMKTASAAMKKLMNSYQMSVDEAGSLVVSLARVGVEEENVKRLSEEVVAIEKVHGLGAQETAQAVMDVADSYQMTADQASIFLRSVREATKTVPGLSMTEATSDMLELVRATRAYNVDLLGVAAMYNTLISKDVAKKLGLGDLPKAARKELAMTVAGFSDKLSDGLKAALGQEEGSSLAEALMNFEKMDPAKKFVKMAQFITKNVAQFTGAEQEFAVRQWLKEFGFTSSDIQETLQKAFVSGGFSAEGLEGVLKEVGKQRDILEKAGENDAVNRAKLLAEAQGIAAGLAGWEARLEQAVRKAFFGSADFGKLKESIDAILAWMQENLPKLATGMISLLTAATKYLQIMAGAETVAKAEEEARAYKEVEPILKAGYAAIPEIEKAMPPSVAKELPERLFGEKALDPLVEEIKQLSPAYAQTIAAQGPSGGYSQRATALSLALSQVKHEPNIEAGVQDEIVELAEALATKNMNKVIRILRAQLHERSQLEKQGERATRIAKNPQSAYGAPGGTMRKLEGR